MPCGEPVPVPCGEPVAIGCLMLSDFRRGRGLTPEGLAVLAKKSRTQIYAWESTDEPSWPILVELCVTRMKYRLAAEARGVNCPELPRPTWMLIAPSARLRRLGCAMSRKRGSAILL